MVEWWLVGAGGGGCRAAGEHRWPIVAAEEGRGEEEGVGELGMVSPDSGFRILSPDCARIPPDSGF